MGNSSREGVVGMYGPTSTMIGKTAYVGPSKNDIPVNTDVLNAINGDKEAQNRIAYSNLTNNYYGNDFNPADLAHAILSDLNLMDPEQYLQSAWDIANLNTMTSQALAREQMKFQREENARAMNFNSSEALKTRNWEQMMSNTAHQREVEDLIKAGLNPILSANQGAATPSVANAQGVTSSGAKGTVDTQAVAAMISAYSTAWQMKMQEKQIDAQLVMNAINNETTRYAADRGANASVAAAGLNSSATRYSADINKMIYESGYHGLNSVAGSVIDKVLDGSFSILGTDNPSEAMKKMLIDQMPWATPIINGLFGDTSKPTGRTQYNEDYNTRGSGQSDGRGSGIRYSTD